MHRSWASRSSSSKAPRVWIATKITKVQVFPEISWISRTSSEQGRSATIQKEDRGYSQSATPIRSLWVKVVFRNGESLWQIHSVSCWLERTTQPFVEKGHAVELVKWMSEKLWSNQGRTHLNESSCTLWFDFTCRIGLWCKCSWSGSCIVSQIWGRNGETNCLCL